MPVPHSPDEAEHIAMAGEAIPVALLPGDDYRWRVPLSSHPSTRWQLAFQHSLDSAGSTPPRMAGFDRGALIVESDEATLSVWLARLPRWIEKANAEIAARVIQELRIVVTFLPECAQWRWELRRGSEIVESSWASHWLAYPSRTEAAKAGAKRLTALQDATARATAATQPAGSDESTRDAA